MNELKDKILDYIKLNPNDKVIKPAIIKESLSLLFTDLISTNSNKDLKIKANLVIYDLKEFPICYCGSKLEFVGKDKASIFITKFGGWREFCSSKCSMSSPKVIERRKQSTLERFGETSYAKTRQFKDDFSVPWSEEKKALFNVKVKTTSLQKYGVEHTSKRPEYLEIRTNTCQEKYGVNNTFQLRDKVIAGQKAVFGGKVSWMQTESGKKHFTENNPMSTSEISEKSRINRYITNWKDVPEDFLKAIINTDTEKFIEIIDELFHTYDKSRLLIARHLNIDYTTLCRYIRKFDVQDRYISPRGVPSVGERELYDFVKSLFSDTIQGSRSILGDSRELDIYVPSKKLAIEYNGVYYHSEFSGNKDLTYHISKTNLCENQGIQLLHILDSEWNDPIKQKIIKSIISHKSGITETKIFARKCILREISSIKASEFLNVNHISGFKGARYHHGLFYKEELVSVMSIGYTNFGKKEEYEITRFASKINTSIIGGLTKLIKSFELDKPLISYADRRFSSILNSSYSKVFKYSSTTIPNWWGYHKSDFILKHRLSFTRKKLKELTGFDDNKSSFDNMILTGHDRIWDCGSIKFYN